MCSTNAHEVRAPLRTYFTQVLPGMHVDLILRLNKLYQAMQWIIVIVNHTYVESSPLFFRIKWINIKQNCSSSQKQIIFGFQLRTLIQHFLNRQLPACSTCKLPQDLAHLSIMAEWLSFGQSAVRRVSISRPSVYNVCHRNVSRGLTSRHFVKATCSNGVHEHVSLRIETYLDLVF